MFSRGIAVKHQPAMLKPESSATQGGNVTPTQRAKVPQKTITRSSQHDNNVIKISDEGDTIHMQEFDLLRQKSKFKTVRKDRQGQ